MAVLTPKSDIVRSSHQKCSIKKGALKNFAKFTDVFFVILKNTWTTASE